jgi:hypothetical protein
LSKEDIKAIEKFTGIGVRVPGGKGASRKRIKEEEKGQGAPERPLTGFFLYMKELRGKGEDKEMSAQEFVKQSAERWRAMSQDDKQVSLGLVWLDWVRADEVGKGVS